MKKITLKTLLVTLLLLLGTAEFVVRGPVRYYLTGFGWSDMTQVYVPARAWVEGVNPYSSKDFVAVRRQALRDLQDDSNIRTHSPYPITSLVVMFPVAALPWRLAHVVCAFLLGLAAVPMILAVIKLSTLTDRTQQLLFAALALALAPLHSGIAAGNVSMFAIALCSTAVSASESGNEATGGALLAVGACLKPQLGVWFVLYYLLRKRWLGLLVATTLSTLVVIVGVLRLWWAGTQWVPDFLANAKGFALDNRLADFTQADPLRFTLINLQVLIYALTGSKWTSQWSALLIGSCLCLTWIYFGFWKRRDQSQLLVLSTMATISLLPLYHRNYDAALLLFPLCWSFSDFTNGHRRISALCLILLVPFAIPGPAVLQNLAQSGHLPLSIVHAWWWNTLVMPHEIWLLCAISVLLLIALARSSGEKLPAPSCGELSDSYTSIGQ